MNRFTASSIRLKRVFPKPHPGAWLRSFLMVLIFSLFFSWRSNPKNLEPSRPIEGVLEEEIIELRTPNQKVYRLPNGQYRARINSQLVHYLDDNSQYQKIKISLEPTETGWEQTRSSFRATLPLYADGVFTFVNANKPNSPDTYTLKPLFTQKVFGKLNTDPQSPYFKQEVLYPGAYGPGIDLLFRLKPDGVEKLVVIKDKDAINRNQAKEFSFELDLAGFPRIRNQGNIWNRQNPLITTENILLENTVKTWLKDFTVWDSTGETWPLTVRLERKNNTFVLTKLLDPNVLEKAIFPVYTDATSSFNTTAGDGHVQYSSATGVDWTVLHDSLTGTAYNSTAATFENRVTAPNTASNIIIRGFLPLDTSGLPDALIITSARVALYPNLISIGDNDGNDFITVVQSTQASTNTLSNTDYSKDGSVSNPVEGSDRIDLNNLTLNAYNFLTLNATGSSWINPTGVTKLGIREGHDVLNDPPSGTNRIRFYTLEAVTNTPYLEITYTAGDPNSAVTVDAISPNPGSSQTPTITGSALDSDGTIAAVDYQVDSTSGSWSSCSADDGTFDEASETFTCTVGTALTEGVHTLYFRSTDNAGNTSTIVSSNYTADITPPTKPGTPSTTSALNDTTPTWTFAASTDALSGLASNAYTVRWSQTSDFSSGVSTDTMTTSACSGGTCSYTHQLDLVQGTWYFQIIAYDAVGNNISSDTSSGFALNPIAGATYYLAPDLDLDGSSPDVIGSDSNNGTSTSTPWKTFARALRTGSGTPIQAGDTLVILDGIYQQSIAPYGTEGIDGSLITITAQNDGNVIIDGQYSRVPLNFTHWSGNSYFEISGISARDSSGAVYDFTGADHINLRRVSGYNADVNGNFMVFTLGDASSHILLEDCIAAGTGRKMIMMYQSQYQTVRRCFADWHQWDGLNTTQAWPWGENIDIYSTNDSTVENSIGYGRVSDYSFTFRAKDPGRTANNNKILGSVAVYASMNKDPFQPMDWSLNSLPAGKTEFVDSYEPDGRVGMRFFGTSSNQLDNNLIKDFFAYGNASYGMVLGASVYNANPTNTVIDSITLTGNTLEPISGHPAGGDMQKKDYDELTTGTNTLTNSRIAKIWDGTANTSANGTGATIQNRYVNGSLTADSLWPWPMEDRATAEYLREFGTANFSITQTICVNILQPEAAVTDCGYTANASPSATLTAVSPDPTADNTPALSGSAADSDGTIQNVEYQVDSTSGSWTSCTADDGAFDSANESYTCLVSSLTDGAHTVYVRSIDNLYYASTPASDTFTVDSTSPGISLIYVSPDPTADTTPQLSGIATDVISMVSGVEYQLNSTVGAWITCTADDGAFDEQTENFTCPVGSALSSGSYVAYYRATDSLSNMTAANYPQDEFVVRSVVAPSIANITTNEAAYSLNQIPQFSKLEISFDVSTNATNYFFPYDSAPPANVDVTDARYRGVTVSAVFTDPGGVEYTQPAFFYHGYTEETRQSWDGATHEWYYPSGQDQWKVRFAPNQAGTWQYKLRVQDEGGTSESSPQSFTVISSANKGFIKVSATDNRYFEFDNGDLFTGLGFETDAKLDKPVLSNQTRFQTFQQNGINFLRTWVSSLYGTAWLEWVGGRNLYDGYLPRSGTRIIYDSTNDDYSFTLALDGANSGWFDACRYQFNNDPPPVKPNTSYRVRVEYWGQGIIGPTNEAYASYGMVAKIGGSATGNCHLPGGNNPVVTTYGNNSSQWAFIEGTWSSGSNNFLPRMYLALENATGRAYVRSISVQEDLGNNNYGPNILKEGSFEYQTYVPDQEAYALDKVVSLAETNELYLKLVIMEKDDSIYLKHDDDGTVVYGGEPDNLDGFYGLGRPLNKTRWLQQAWWRYAQARWGYSTAIHSWEAVNEGNPASTAHYQLTDEMGKYFHCDAFNVSSTVGDGQPCSLNHPNKHLVTTSFYHSFPGNTFWGSSSYPNVDYADVHAYISTSNVINFATAGCSKAEMENDAAAYHYCHSSQLVGWNIGKPIVRGEAGMDRDGSQSSTILNLQRDTSGVWLHNYLWSSLDQGGLYELYWWATDHIYYSYDHDANPATPNLSVDHRPAYQALATFLASVPLNNGYYQNAAATISNANLRAWGQKDLTNNRAHLWIQNKNHTWNNVVNGTSINSESGTVSLAGFSANQPFLLSWHDTSATESANQVTSTQVLSSDSGGNLAFSVSSLAGDTAVKLAALTRPSVNLSALSPDPSADATPTLSGNATATYATVTLVEYQVDSTSGSWTSCSAVDGTFDNAAESFSCTSTTLPDGAHTLYVRATDSNGLQSNATSDTFTIEATAPSIQNISVTANTGTSVTITWVTSKASSSQLDYGLSTSYGSQTTEENTSSRVITHTQTLTNLVPCATYHFRVRSADALANQTQSSGQTVTTAGCAASSAVLSQAVQPVTFALGGSLQLLDNASHGLVLTVPAGFGVLDATFQAHQLQKSTVFTSISSPAGKTLVANYLYDLKSLTSPTQTVSTFLSPLSVNFDYTSSDLASFEPGSLSIYRYDGAQWHQLSNCSQPGQNSYACTTTEFSVFGLFGTAVTPSPTPTSQQSVSDPGSGSADGGVSSYSCPDGEPGSSPVLFSAAARSANVILLSFTPAKQPLTSYAVEYGLKSGEYLWSNTLLGDAESSQLEIGSLEPSTTYYFRLRANNGCSPGAWSGEISAKTLKQSKSKPVIVATELKATNHTEDSAPTPTSAGTTPLPIYNLSIPSVTPSPLQTSDDSNTLQTVTIIVLNQKRLPIPGAKVTLYSSPKVSFTDQQGRAIFKNIEPGQHRLLIEHDDIKTEQNLLLSDTSSDYDVTVTLSLPSKLNWLIITIAALLLVPATLIAVLAYRKYRQH